MEKNAKIYVAGHTGLVGSALMRFLKQNGYINITTVSHSKCNLENELETNNFFMCEKPEYVIVAAAKVGGIQANSDYIADFTMANAKISCNVINAAFNYGVKKLLYLGSSCIYPRECSQPIKEEYLLSGPLEPTNEGYALAKILGVKLCEYYKKQYGTNFISCMPVNLYGPNDCYNSSKNHVIPALIQRFHNAAKIQNLSLVEIWGTGNARREFMYVDDAAEACVFLMNNYDGEAGIINVGINEDISISELSKIISNVVGYKGKIVFDTTKPDGMPRRLLDSSRIINMGFKAKTSLNEGLKQSYKWFIESGRNKNA